MIITPRRIIFLFATCCATALLASCTATPKPTNIASNTSVVPATAAKPKTSKDAFEDKHQNLARQTTQQRIDQLQKDQLQAFSEKCTHSAPATHAETTTSQTPRAAVTAKPKISQKPLTEYTVQTGENLYSIAARNNIYQEGLLWPLIYTANRDQIKDPQQIFPGQTLTITRNHNEEEKQNARETARNSGIFVQQHDNEQSTPLSTR